MKVCTKCKEAKALSEFRVVNAATGRHAAYCKSCQRQVSRDHYSANRETHKRRVISNSQERAVKNREWFKEFKASLSCNRCGEDHIAVLDFHHSDPATKEQAVGTMLYSWSKEAILQEIAKCEVLCSNCHRKHHWDEKQT